MPRTIAAASYLVLALLACVAGRAPLAHADIAKDLKSKDVAARLSAVEALHRDGGEEAEELLLKALGDKDWEVMEHAAAALGKHGGEDAVKELADVALSGPVRRVRMAAAQSLAKLDSSEGAARIAKRSGGKLAQAACEALVVIALNADDPSGDTRDLLRSGLDRGLASAEPTVRKAAARGLAAFPSALRASRLGKLLRDPDVGVVCAALDGASAAPDDAYLNLLVAQLGDPKLLDVIERRVHAAIVDVATARYPDGVEELLDPIRTALESGARSRSAASLARVVGLLAQPRPADKPELEDFPPVVSADWALATLEPALTHDEPEARAAAVHALGRIGHEKGFDRAAVMADTDEAERVRLHAMRTVAHGRGLENEDTFRLVCKRAVADDAPRVREEAVVQLGVRGLQGAVPSLEKAIADKNWSVAVCAAVSLGKTGDPAALAPLQNLFETTKDWKLRGAAVVGLGRLQHKDAVPVLIKALGNTKETAVARSAYEFLRRLPPRGVEVAPKPKAWTDWWTENAAGYEFIDHEEEARKAKKYGYAPDRIAVYEGLDVIVLQSRGDHIEKLLEKLEIKHRLTRGGQVPKSELHPFGVFVSNCTGEMTSKDIEQIAWFIRVGGYLFCSCWALNKTAELVYPGVVRKLPTSGQVLDNVVAEPCPTDSSYLEDVFDGVTQPVYVLYGSHLIEVMDPERVEVLIDSPDCAARWGGGNLACWFTTGHGVILDSANHFDLQGLERAPGLKSDEDRMAYAMDHMGLDYAELRRLDKEKVWKSSSKANKAARDLSAFRFITNFVRQKRRIDP